jgi:hypothetical protein
MMSGSNRTNRWATTAVLGLSLLATTVLTGCQSTINGQTLPSPYYMQDDVQYFPSGPEFKLSREAAAIKAARAEQNMQRR